MHQQDVLNAESFGSNDVYLRKLEMNIKFLNSQIKELTQDKSHLQTINENLENEFRILSDKLYAEIEEKYKKEIDEKDFIIKSLKRDFELYMHMDGDSAQRASFRKTLKKKIVRPVRYVRIFGIFNLNYRDQNLKEKGLKDPEILKMNTMIHI